MDKQTCSKDMHKDKQHGHATWTRSMDIPHGHAARTSTATFKLLYYIYNLVKIIVHI
jgi:hypothetical protein